MSTQHSAIPDGQRHEPKGISTATSGQVYSANGSASGTWTKIVSSMLNGISGDGGVANKRVVTDGSGNFKLSSEVQHGTMAITNNTNAFTVTAASDSSLNTNSDYAVFTGTGAPWASEQLYGVTFTTDRLIAPVAGVYRIDLWSNITGFPSNAAKVSVKHRINGTTYSTRHPMDKSNSAGDSGNISGFGLVTLSANDYIQLMVASTVSGSLTLSDVNVTLTLIRAT